MENDEQVQNLDCWAIVDLFGHQKIAGKLTTQTLGAAALIRVDVPQVVIPEQRNNVHRYVGREYKLVEEVTPARTKGGYTRFFGVGAIYSINPVSEELVRRAVASIDSEPVTPYEIRALPALPAAQGVEDEQEPEEEVIERTDG